MTPEASKPNSHGYIRGKCRVRNDNTGVPAPIYRGVEEKSC